MVGHAFACPDRTFVGGNHASIQNSVFGTGFVGRVHLEGIRSWATPVSPSAKARWRSGGRWAPNYVPKIDSDYRGFWKTRVEPCTFVHQLLHYPMAKDAPPGRQARDLREAARHFRGEARSLVALAAETHRRNCTFHNLRFYPWCSTCAAMRRMATWARSCGAGHLFQDWRSTTPTGTGAGFQNQRPLALPGDPARTVRHGEHVAGLAPSTSLWPPISRPTTRPTKRPKDRWNLPQDAEAEDYVETPIDTRISAQ